MRRSNLEKGTQKITDTLQNVGGNTIFRLGVAHSPVETLNLICQYSGFSIRQQNLKRVSLDLRGHRAREEKACFPVIRCWTQNKSRPFAGLLVTNCGIEINPDGFSGIGNPIFYQASAPTGSPHRSSPCRFSGVILAVSSSIVNKRAAALITTSPWATTSSTTVLPSRNPASSATYRGILIAKLFPHRLICVLAVSASPPTDVTIHACRYNVYTIVCRIFLRRKPLKRKGGNEREETFCGGDRR